ncbi:MAG: acyltransferase family protein [Eubacterium sp.]
MNKCENRIEWLDNAKGLAIILVVVGHLIQTICPDLQLLFKFIYSFHMPVFFIISGYFIEKSSKNKSFLEFANNKAKQLMLPYLFFVILTAIYDLLTSLLTSDLDNTINQFTENLLSTLLIQNDSYFINLWFLPCLFSAMVLIKIIYQITNNEWIRTAICCIGAISILLLKNKFSICLPLCMDNAFVALPYLHLGHLTQKSNVIQKLQEKHSACLGVCVLSFIILICTNIFIFKNTPNDYADSFRALRFYSPFSLITAISGSASIILLGVLLNNSKILNNVGQKSNLIYGLHFLFLGIIGKICSLIPKTIVTEILELAVATIIVISSIMFISFIMDKIIYRINERKKRSENSSNSTYEVK